MKGISLWQPHASLIIIGAKPLETRSWPAHQPVIGTRIWIHAAKAKDDLIELAEYCQDLQEGFEVDEYYDKYRQALVDGGLTKIGDIPLGCIIGSAVLIWSRPTSQVRDPGPFGDFSRGRFAWRMTEPKALPTPVPFKGKQGFFDVPDDLPGLQDAIHEQVRIAN